MVWVTRTFSARPPGSRSGGRVPWGQQEERAGEEVGEEAKPVTVRERALSGDTELLPARPGDHHQWEGSTEVSRWGGQGGRGAQASFHHQ